MKGKPAGAPPPVVSLAKCQPEDALLLVARESDRNLAANIPQSSKALLNSASRWLSGEAMHTYTHTQPAASKTMPAAWPASAPARRT